MSRGHLRLVAVTVAVAAGAAALSLQPLRSSWWTGDDWDAVFLASGLSLAAGDNSEYYDHPGTPVQQLVGLTFTGRWLATGAGDRSARVYGWMADLGGTRWYFRTLAAVLLLATLTLVTLVLGWTLGHPLWGLLGGLAFLTVPDVTPFAAVLKTDTYLAAFSLVTVAVCAVGFRHRSGSLYALAAALLGFTMTIKLHAVGLLPALLLAVALRPPPRAWLGALIADARRRLARRRYVVGGAIWFGLAVVLAAAIEAPARRDALAFGVLLAAFALVAVLARRLRRSPLTLVVALAGAALGGAIVPNLLYAAMLPRTFREVGLSLVGRGVNSNAEPLNMDWHLLEPWRLVFLLAAIGLVRAMRAREYESGLWAAALVAMGILAAARSPILRYHAPTVALAIPLALRALRGRTAAPSVLAAAIAVVAFAPAFTHEVDYARAHTKEFEQIDATDEWLQAHLHPGEVALTTHYSDDPRYLFIQPWAPAGPPPRQRVITLSPGTVPQTQRRLPRYLFLHERRDPHQVLAQSGITARIRRVAGGPQLTPPRALYELFRPKIEGTASASAANA